MDRQWCHPSVRILGPAKGRVNEPLCIGLGGHQNDASFEGLGILT